MKKKIRKIVSVMLCMAIVSAMSVSTFAAASIPSSDDTARVYIMNVDSGSTVTAYKVVNAVYNSNGLTGYEVVNGVSIADIENITDDEVTAIALDAINGEVALTSAELTDSGSDYFYGSLTAGTWIVVVTNNGETIYNPMAVSCYYTDANDASSLEAGTVDANGNFNEDDTLYAKSIEGVGDDKTVEVNGEEVHAASANVGDTVSYTWSGIIPAYSDAYAQDILVYTMTDTMSSGLDPVTSVDVYVVSGVEKTAVAASTSTYVVTYSGQTFTVEFASSFIYSHRGYTVVIEYSTTINSEALTYNLVTNSYSVEYTNAPDGGTYTVKGGDDPEDIVKIYTFTLGDGGEIISVNSSYESLADTTFGIYTDADCTQLYTNDYETDGLCTTASDGYVIFEGLSEGTYYIKETSAASGYYIIDTVYTVDIEVTWNEGQTAIDYYTVTVTDEDGNSRVSTYTYNDDGDEIVSEDINTTYIISSKLAILPSTGGSGIYIFAGAALVLFGICSAAVLGRSRKGSRA